MILGFLGMGSWDLLLATLGWGRVQGYRWQAVKWCGAASLNSGSCWLQTGITLKQRVWNRQPLGGFAGDGTSPERTIDC